jgi:hypothetical protein
MKITKKHNDGLTAFCTLKTGDTFLFDHLIYLKLDRIDPADDGDYINAICLDSGEVDGFNAETRVKRVNTELIVEV